MKKWKIYLINLARSTDRLAACARQFEEHELSFERIEAIDGDKLSPASISEIYDFSHSSYHKHMTNGEIACYLSHVKVWQKVVDEQLDYAVILEDDILLKDDILEGLEAVHQIQQPWDLIKLAEAPEKRKVVHQYPVDDFSLVTYNKVPIRCCAQVISLSGAKKLLAKSANVTRPIDIELQYWWESDLNIFGLKPYIVKPNQNLVSEIDRESNRKKAKQSFPRKVVSGFYFLFKNKKELSKRLEQLSK
ncbi:glycosyltransferase family 25 protein [Glaciecola sp.]|jgi:glycosyl transferase family 25|uniref:glycosyltransferase family 25 protein n=1 Tax=Glaciecola sp. MF2-115 TaxID=3384827 RepID=UPI003988CEAC